MYTHIPYITTYIKYQFNCMDFFYLSSILLIFTYDLVYNFRINLYTVLYEADLYIHIIFIYLNSLYDGVKLT